MKLNAPSLNTKPVIVQRIVDGHYAAFAVIIKEGCSSYPLSDRGRVLDGSSPSL